MWCCRRWCSPRYRYKHVRGGIRLRRYDLSRDDGFEHRADQILRAVDDATKLVLVNSPHNPTGAVIEPSELAILAESLAEREIPLVVDEVYHPLYFDGRATTAVPPPNTIIIGDLSKAYSLSGLRIGWVIDADRARRERLIDARGYFTISNSVVTEFLAVISLNESRTFVGAPRAGYTRESRGIG